MLYRIETEEPLTKKRIYEIEADSKDEALDIIETLGDDPMEEFIFSEGIETTTLVEYLDEEGFWIKE